MIKQGMCKSRDLLPSVFLTILLGLAIGILSVIFVEDFESIGITYLLVGLLGLLTFGPIAQRIIYRSLDLAEPGIWFVLFYFMHFGVRAIYDLTYGSPVLGFGPAVSEVGLLNTALGVSVLGLLSFWLGYHLRLGKAVSNSLPSLPHSWNRSLVLPISLFCLAFGWGLRVFLIFYQAGGVSTWLEANKYVVLAQSQGIVYLNILSNLATIGLLIIFILARICHSRRYWLLFTLFLVPELAFRFVSGSRAQFIFLLFGFLIGLYMTSKREHRSSMRYAKWAAILIVFLVIFFPLFSIIRGGIRSPREMLLRVSSFWRDPMALFYLVEERQHGLDSLALVIHHVPKDENYTLGSELSLLTIAWIPRKIWPDKPIISLGKIFYEKFYPPIYHEGTSVAVTLPGEFYWDLGIVGVIIGMLLIGILWRFFLEYLVRPKGNLSNILVASLTFPTFFVTVEQTIDSLLTMHLFQFLVVALVALTIRGRTIEMEVSH